MMQLLIYLSIFSAAITFGGCTQGKYSKMDKKLVREKVTSIMPEIKICYRKQLAADSKIEGKLILQWELLPDGKVGFTKVIQSLATKLDNCVAEKISELQFDKPPKGVMPIVEYPFVFNKE